MLGAVSQRSNEMRPMQSVIGWQSHRPPALPGLADDMWDCVQATAVCGRPLPVLRPLNAEAALAVHDHYDASGTCIALR